MVTSLAELARGWGEVRQQLTAPPRVLIVDDEATVRELFSAVLTKAKFVCTACDSAEAALRVFAKGRFELLVADKNLPGLGGLDLIARIRSQDPECEAVLATSYPNLESVVRAIDLQNVEFLTKPLDSIEVLTAVLGRALLRRTRRILAKRMLADLRGALNAQADGPALPELAEARTRVDEFRRVLELKRRVVCWQGEDDEVRDGLGALAENGFEILELRSGAQIVAQCERHRVSVLVVSDNFGDIDGAHLVEKVAEVEGHPEFVYVTAQSSFEHAVAATQQGAAGFLVKPLRDPRPLVHAVRRACDLHQERMVHFKMVNELSRILLAIEQRRETKETRDTLESTLAAFDVRTAEHAVRDNRESR